MLISIFPLLPFQNYLLVCPFPKRTSDTFARSGLIMTGCPALRDFLCEESGAQNLCALFLRGACSAR